MFTRPHPKDGEDTVFTGVCLSTPGGGVPQRQVLSQVTGPRSFPEGTPVPGSFPGHRSQALSGEYPSPQWGYLSMVPSYGQARMGYPQPGQDRVPPSQDSTGVPPGQVRMGYDPPQPGWGTTPPTARTGYHPQEGQDGVPLARSGWGAPQTEQQCKHLLRGGRYASCLHTGGLSCLP